MALKPLARSEQVLTRPAADLARSIHHTLPRHVASVRQRAHRVADLASMTGQSGEGRDLSVRCHAAEGNGPDDRGDVIVGRGLHERIEIVPRNRSRRRGILHGEGRTLSCPHAYRPETILVIAALCAVSLSAAPGPSSTPDTFAVPTGSTRLEIEDPEVDEKMGSAFVLGMRSGATNCYVESLFANPHQEGEITFVVKPPAKEGHFLVELTHTGSISNELTECVRSLFGSFYHYTDKQAFDRLPGTLRFTPEWVKAPAPPTDAELRTILDQLREAGDRQDRSGCHAGGVPQRRQLLLRGLPSLRLRRRARVPRRRLRDDLPSLRAVQDFRQRALQVALRRPRLREPTPKGRRSHQRQHGARLSTDLLADGREELGASGRRHHGNQAWHSAVRSIPVD